MKNELQVENVTCPNCGHVFIAAFAAENPSVVCPDCGKEFTPENK